MKSASLEPILSHVTPIRIQPIVYVPTTTESYATTSEHGRKQNELRTSDMLQFNIGPSDIRTLRLLPSKYYLRTVHDSQLKFSRARQPPATQRSRLNPDTPRGTKRQRSI